MLDSRAARGSHSTRGSASILVCYREPEAKMEIRLKQLGVVAECSDANQDGSVYSTRCSAANAVYRKDQWQRRSKHTELES
jgi:hypothetical protein